MCSTEVIIYLTVVNLENDHMLHVKLCRVWLGLGQDRLLIVGLQVRTVLLLKTHVFSNSCCMAKTINVDESYDSTSCLFPV